MHRQAGSFDNDRMKRNQPAFKDTQLFDWDSEPALERSSSFFYPDELSAAEVRRNQREQARKSGRFTVVLLACVAVLGLGFAALIEFAPVLQHIRHA